MNSSIFKNSEHRTRMILFPEHRTKAYLSNKKTYLFAEQERAQKREIFKCLKYLQLVLRYVYFGFHIWTNPVTSLHNP